VYTTITVQKDIDMGLCLLLALSAETLQECKYFRLLDPLLDHLHRAAPKRGRAGNRQSFDDQDASLRLPDVFHPVMTSVCSLQPTTTLAKGPERLGVRPTSLRALGEAAYVFDAGRLHEVLTTLGAQLRPHLPRAEHAALAQLTAVDGSLVSALPRMAWALWQDEQHRAAKRHVAFAVLRQGPGDGTVTAGNCSERAAGRRLVPPGGFYVVDRGDVDDRVFQARPDLPCRCICRVQDNAAYEGQEARPLSPAAVPVGGVHEAGLRRLGTAQHPRLLPQPFHLVPVATGKTRQDGSPAVMVLGTNRRELDAGLIAVAYRSRWAVELVFRWVKCVLGCRQLLSHRSYGVRRQVYAAVIASVLISLQVGRAPTKRTYERRCFYLSGWATEAEVIAQIDRLHLRAPPTCKR
jgi:hypothetical protein